MTSWGNAIGNQIVWFCAVIGAGRDAWWPGVAAAAVFMLSHFAFARQTPAQRAIDFRLLGIALLIGVLLDGSIAASGLARYAADELTLPSGGAPLWILGLWVSFALTLRHSMRFLLERPLIAVLLGAIGGPLAYLGAARGWQAIVFAEPRWAAVVALAFGWGIAIPLLTTLAARWSQTEAAFAAITVKRS
jgi:hypothetical protein